jgi:translation initiation factor 2 subunit 3
MVAKVASKKPASEDSERSGSKATRAKATKEIAAPEHKESSAEPKRHAPKRAHEPSEHAKAPAKETKHKRESPAESPVNEPVQPEVNIGLVGHVDHGKTTLTERLSGKWTDTHSEEIKRGITIRLGYADFTIRKRADGMLTTKEVDPDTNKRTTPLRKLSLVDAPGHESLMATMLAGATIVDGALLLVAANELCPQPQTREHLMALEMCGIDKLIVVQNKIDLVSKERALRNHQQIKEFLKGTKYENAPVIPVSAQRGVNIDLLLEAIQEFIPTPRRDESVEPVMYVARSFDINKPGSVPESIRGGVLGGALKQGRLKVGDTIELRPGRVYEEANQIRHQPILTVIASAITGGVAVESIGPGGSIGIMTDLDPAVVKADSLTGNLVGLPGKLPPVWNNLLLETTLMERVVGSAEELKVNPIVPNELLMLNVNSAATVGVVRQIAKNRISCVLKKPVCAALGSRVTISRRVGTRFRLIGYGIIREK